MRIKTSYKIADGSGADGTADENGCPIAFLLSPALSCMQNNRQTGRFHLSPLSAVFRLFLMMRTILTVMLSFRAAVGALRSPVTPMRFNVVIVIL